MAKRAKQTEIPGTELPTIKEIDDALEVHKDAVDEFVKARDKVKSTRTGVINVMKKHELTVYKDVNANLACIITEGAVSVKVSEIEDSPVDEEDENGNEAA